MRSLIAALLLASPAIAQDRPVIVADSYPMAYFAQRLARDAAEVRLVVPGGRDPASWRPTLSDIAGIQSADLIVLNGSGLADWTTRASLPRSRTVDTGRGLRDDLIATDTITHSHGAEGSHSHEGVATHTWLDLGLAIRQAEALAPALSRAVPNADIDTNLAALTEDLTRLDDLGDALTDAGVPVIASHPRYEYLGRAYGLDITALDWPAGEAPSAEQLAALQSMAADTGAQTFIWEATPAAEGTAAVEALGLSQVVFAPLSMPPVEGDFATVMERQLSALAEALQGR